MNTVSKAAVPHRLRRAAAELIYAGSGEPVVPAGMGRARPDQLAGSPADNLIELAGRVCYDSLGATRSRNSAEYHTHINATGHHSTHEHVALTVLAAVPAADYASLLEAVAGRPGVYVRPDGNTVGDGGRRALRLTVNPRVARDWSRWSAFGPGRVSEALGRRLKGTSAMVARLAAGDLAVDAGYDEGMTVRLVRPESDHETWASVYVEGVSRGLTHELVRHGDFTAISQRSTRYVDESESGWIPHPLFADDESSMADFVLCEDACSGAYDRTVARMQQRLTDAGIEKFAARKQARGAARGMLGNALETKLIFSASVAQWKWIFAKRASNPADAEIRVLAADVCRLMKDAFPDRFASGDWDLLPAYDGIGEVVRCGD